MLNVTDHYCISPATSKGGFPVIRVICHESVIYVTGHVSHRSEAQGLLPRITRQSETFLIACVAWRFCRAARHDRRSREKKKNRLPGFEGFLTAAPFTSESLRIDDFPEDDDVSTLEVVYAHALPDVALFRASS